MSGSMKSDGMIMTTRPRRLAPCTHSRRMLNDSPRSLTMEDLESSNYMLECSFRVKRRPTNLRTRRAGFGKRLTSRPRHCPRRRRRRMEHPFRVQQVTQVKQSPRRKEDGNTTNKRKTKAALGTISKRTFPNQSKCVTRGVPQVFTNDCQINPSCIGRGLFTTIKSRHFFTTTQNSFFRDVDVPLAGREKVAMSGCS